MKKLLLLSMTFALLPLSLMAQDDMYFGSTKQKSSPRRNSSTYQSGYYSGSSRSVDDYNRRGSGSNYEVIKTDTGDVISFSPVEGTYPDSEGDFAMTRKMTRFDDYTPTAAYWEGYDQGRRDSWDWHSPWYYTSSYYPWYDYGWYDSWYRTSWRWGWYDPWYYDYSWRWGWSRPYYYSSYYGWGGYYGGYYSHSSRYHGNGNTGTLSRYSGDRRSSSSGRVSNYTSSSRFNGARDRAYGTNSGSGRSTYSGSTNRSVSRSSTRTNTSTSSSSYSVPRSSSSSGSSFSNSSSYGSSRSSSVSSYGSSRSSGGSFGGGGSRSGGGSSRSGGGRR